MHKMLSIYSLELDTTYGQDGNFLI